VNDRELPEHVRRFIHSDVPNIDALEVLLVFARRPGEVVTPRAVVDAIRPTAVSESVVRAYLAMLQAHGVLTVRGDDGFAYYPRSTDVARAVDGLLAAYNERPVTLVRTVYAIADARGVQSFADAFRLRTEP
jgi:hypothetical protein